MDSSKLLGISAAARKVECSEETLRRYEREGVVHPVRDSTNRRLFGLDDVEAAKQRKANTKAGNRNV